MIDIIKNYALNAMKSGKRIDGRAFDEYREPIKVEYGISSKSAEGSARVIIG